MALLVRLLLLLRPCSWPRPPCGLRACSSWLHGGFSMRRVFREVPSAAQLLRLPSSWPALCWPLDGQRQPSDGPRSCGRPSLWVGRNSPSRRVRLCRPWPFCDPVCAPTRYAAYGHGPRLLVCCLCLQCSPPPWEAYPSDRRCLPRRCSTCRHAPCSLLQSSRTDEAPEA